MIKAVIFDWGNTLMREFPEFSGAMALWPKVEAIPGITEALDELCLSYQCFVASNAVDSDADLIEDALRRVGIDRFFERYFTSKELGTSKPDPAFFEQILRTTGLKPEECVMVGDSYERDVMPAGKLGMKTVLFREGNPTDPPPFTDAVIASMSDLPAVISRLASASSDVVIRHITEDDAEAFLRMLLRMDQEAECMLIEPGERTTTVDQQREMIKTIISRPNSTIFVAESGEEIVGFLQARGGDYKRNRHSIYIVVGILEAFTGRKIGTRLFEEMERWAKDVGAHRLELTVMTHNHRAVALYKKMGFTIEGTKKHSFLVDGSYVDDYYMGKLL